MYFNPILTKPTFPNALTSGHIACNRDHCWTNLRRKSLGKNGTSIFYCPSAISKKVSSCQNKTRTGEVLYHSASTTALAFNWPWRSCCYEPRQCASSRSWTWACPSELQETDLHQRASSTESCPEESLPSCLEQSTRSLLVSNVTWQCLPSNQGYLASASSFSSMNFIDWPGPSSIKNM